MNKPKIAIINHDGNSKKYFFKCNIGDLEAGDRVVVETRYGKEIVTFKAYVPDGAIMLFEPTAWVVSKAFNATPRIKLSAVDKDNKKPYAYYPHEEFNRLVNSTGGNMLAIIEFDGEINGHYFLCHISDLKNGDLVYVKTHSGIRVGAFKGYARRGFNPTQYVIGRAEKPNLSPEPESTTANPDQKPSLVISETQTVVKHFIDTDQVREGSFVSYKKKGSKEFCRGLVSSCDKYNINIKPTRGMDFRINATALANGDSEVKIQMY